VAGTLAQITGRYPWEARLFRPVRQRRYLVSKRGRHLRGTDRHRRLLQRLPGAEVERQKLKSLVEAKTPPSSPEWLNLFGALVVQADGLERAQAEIDKINLNTLRLAVEDLSQAFPDTYRGGAEFLKAILAFEQDLPAVKKALASGDKSALGAFTRLKTCNERLAGQSAVELRPAPARETGLAEPRLAAELAGQLRDLRKRLRQRDRRPLAGAPGRQAEHVLQSPRAASSWATWT